MTRLVIGAHLPELNDHGKKHDHPESSADDVGQVEDDILHADQGIDQSTGPFSVSCAMNLTVHVRLLFALVLRHPKAVLQGKIS